MKLTDLLNPFKSGKSATSHMRNLVEMAAADGHIHESEKQFLKTIAKQYGISDTELADIQNNPTKIEFEVPKDERQKFHQLYDLVKMMGIDNHIHMNEEQLAKMIAIKFGFKPGIARELVEVIRENIKNGSSVEETMKRAQLMIA